MRIMRTRMGAAGQKSDLDPFAPVAWNPWRLTAELSQSAVLVERQRYRKVAVHCQARTPKRPAARQNNTFCREIF
jgi:hypothetical protein